MFAWRQAFTLLQVSFLRSERKYISSLDSFIQVTVEETRSDGFMPSLDTIDTPQADRTFTTNVYRNPTYTDLYLQWDSHHNVESKYSVIKTVTHRAKVVCSAPQLLKEELHHVEEVLMRCK